MCVCVHGIWYGSRHFVSAKRDLVHIIKLISYFVSHMERSIRKWVLWISFYNIKFKFRNINAIGFLFLTQHTTPLLYVKIHCGVLHLRGTDVTRSDTP